MKLRFYEIFLGLGILLIPFSFHLFTFHQEILRWLFVPIDIQIAKGFGLGPQLFDISSDSQLFYIHLLVILILSFIVTVVIKNGLSEDKQRRMKLWLRIAIAYYLSLILFKYGLDKLFLAQFPNPEANLLFTPLGKLDKDILFWSTMGSSPHYSIFMGICELIPAVLLLFHRTRSLGGLLATIVFTNVLAINFSFDISVKIFAGFLVLLSIYLAFPALRNIYNVIIREQITIPLQSIALRFPSKPFVKSFAILAILTEALFPYITSGNFNDDHSSRPNLHGAYENLDPNAEIERVFFHRDNYIIFQNRKDEMNDLSYELNSTENKLIAEDYENNSFEIQILGNYNQHLILKMPDESILKLKKIDTNKLPLLKGQFHWSVD